MNHSENIECQNTSSVNSLHISRRDAIFFFKRKRVEKIWCVENCSVYLIFCSHIVRAVFVLPSVCWEKICRSDLFFVCVWFASIAPRHQRVPVLSFLFFDTRNQVKKSATQQQLQQRHYFFFLLPKVQYKIFFSISHFATNIIKKKSFHPHPCNVISTLLKNKNSICRVCCCIAAKCSTTISPASSPLHRRLTQNFL